MQEKQLVIILHVDDLLISHISNGIVTEHMKRLDSACETQDPLTFNRGKKHECLGMTMCLNVEDGVDLMQHDYVKKLWNMADMKHQCRNAPAFEDMFKLDRDSPLLNAEKTDEHHKITSRSI